MNRCRIFIILYCGWAFLYAGIPGDIDGNGIVDLLDIDILSAQWLDVPGTPSADIASATSGPDGLVNGLDFSVVSGHWLLHVPDANAMVFIDGGAFAMGNQFPDSEPNEIDELPVHLVHVDSFYLGRYEITNGEYCEFLNASLADEMISVINGTVYSDTGSDPNQPYCNLADNIDSNSLIDYSDGLFGVLSKGGREMSNDPMVCVSWYGAVAYCNWRSKTEGYPPCYDLVSWACDFTQHGYRLPTEAEWEYAARGGQDDPYTRFDWGNTIDHTQANYYRRIPLLSYDLATDQHHPAWNDGIFPYTSPVGSFAANGFGVHDMAGNVFEWCNDRYAKTYYNVSPDDNPTGPATGTGRVLRGGSWDHNAGTCRSANRYAKLPSDLQNTYGFRVCLDLD